MASDYKKNPFNKKFEISLNSEKEKNDFLQYLREVLENENDFYAKIIEVISLCAKVRLDDLVVVDEAVENQAFYMDRFIM
jgi:hypothetical protein